MKADDDIETALANFFGALVRFIFVFALTATIVFVVGGRGGGGDLLLLLSKGEFAVGREDGSEALGDFFTRLLDVDGKSVAKPAETGITADELSEEAAGANLEGVVAVLLGDGEGVERAKSGLSGAFDAASEDALRDLGNDGGVIAVGRVETALAADATAEAEEEALGVGRAALAEGAANSGEVVNGHVGEELRGADFGVRDFLRGGVAVEEDVAGDDGGVGDAAGFADVEEGEGASLFDTEAAGLVGFGDFKDGGGLGDGAGGGGGLLDEGGLEGGAAGVGVAEDAEDDLVDVLLGHEVGDAGGVVGLSLLALGDDLGGDGVEGLQDVVDVGVGGHSGGGGDVELDDLGDKGFVVEVTLLDHLGDGSGSGDERIRGDEIGAGKSEEDATNDGGVIFLFLLAMNSDSISNNVVDETPGDGFQRATRVERDEEDGNFGSHRRDDLAELRFGGVRPAGSGGEGHEAADAPALVVGGLGEVFLLALQALHLLKLVASDWAHPGGVGLLLRVECLGLGGVDLLLSLFAALLAGDLGTLSGFQEAVEGLLLVGVLAGETESELSLLALLLGADAEAGFAHGLGGFLQVALVFTLLAFNLVAVAGSLTF